MFEKEEKIAKKVNIYKVINIFRNRMTALLSKKRKRIRKDIGVLGVIDENIYYL